MTSPQQPQQHLVRDSFTVPGSGSPSSCSLDMVYYSFFLPSLSYDTGLLSQCLHPEPMQSFVSSQQFVIFAT